MLAKNFLISHFKTQQVFVLFSLTLPANCRNLETARCVPLPFLEEKESEMNVLLKNG